jgi:hypothetical protein
MLRSSLAGALQSSIKVAELQCVQHWIMNARDGGKAPGKAASGLGSTHRSVSRLMTVEERRCRARRASACDGHRHRRSCWGRATVSPLQSARIQGQQLQGMCEPLVSPSAKDK